MMLLFVLCGTYCSSFAMLENRTRVDNSVHKALDWCNPGFLYCMNYKTTDILTEPGYLCSSIALSTKNTVINKIFLKSCNRGTWYCYNYQYLPIRTPLPSRTFAPTPQRTPVRTPQSTPLLTRTFAATLNRTFAQTPKKTLNLKITKQKASNIPVASFVTQFLYFP